MEIILKDKSWGRSSFELMRTKGMTRTAEEIYTVLLDRCTKANSTIKISTSELARITGRCLKSIINAVKRLIKLKLIHKTPKQKRTETNSFIVVKVLDDKKKNRSVTAEQTVPPAEPEQIQPEHEKPQKKKYGNYGRVRLTDEEYSSLIADFGQEKVAEYIQKVDDYSKDKNRWYPNNAETIRKWLEEDKNKPDKGKNNLGGYRPQKTKTDKTYYNFHGKTYGDLIKELPEEQQAQWYQQIYPSQLDEVATIPLDRLAELNKYDDLVN